MRRKFTWFLILLGLVVLSMVIAYGWTQWRAYQAQQARQAAQTALEGGQPEQAEQILSNLLADQSAPQPWTPQALQLRLQALQAIGDSGALQSVARRMLDPDHPWYQADGPLWAKARAILGEAALAAGNIEEASRYFQPLLDLAKDRPAQQRAMLGVARIEMAQGELTAAQQRLRQLHQYLAPACELRPAVEHALGLVNTRLLAHGEHVAIHTVERGETIAGIAKRYDISPDLLLRINQIQDPRRLSIGRRLRIPDLDFSIVVDKTRNTLTLYNKGAFFKKYRIRTGQSEYMTPNGEFKIRNKVKNPSWTDPRTLKSYPPNHEDNALGARWLGFNQSGLGIHEATDPQTIGHYASQGCVGMFEEDVKELYDLVSLGTPVQIKGHIERSPIHTGADDALTTR